jgi:hypothetical protein
MRPNWPTDEGRSELYAEILSVTSTGWIELLVEQPSAAAGWAAASHLGCRFFRVPGVPAEAAMAAGEDSVADDDALHGHMIACAACGAFVIDTQVAVGKKFAHVRIGRPA